MYVSVSQRHKQVKYNFHIVKPEGRYYHFIQSRIEQAGCRTRKDSTRFVDTLITASPEFFKGKSPKEIQAFFQRAADFLIDRIGRENIVSAVVHMKILLKKKKNDQFQFIGGMKVGEPSADGRGSAPPELAEQQARAGSEAAPATPPL